MKALIVVTSHKSLGSTGKETGYYLPEVSHPYFAILEQGIEVDIASPKGGQAPLDQSSFDLEDKHNAMMWNTPEHKQKLTETIKLSAVNPNEYAAILFAGGHGTMWDFRGHTEIQSLVRKIYENQGVVAAVCHGPAALVDVRLTNGEYLLSGRQVTGFSNAEEDSVELTEVMPFLLEDELKNNGAQYSSAGLWKSRVVVDGRLITGQNPASAGELGAEVAKAIRN